MGFGSGYSVTVDHSHKVATSVRTGARVARILGESSQVAHIWANQTQTFGQNSKGTLYFDGGALYSYGVHYMIGFVVPSRGDIMGATLLNSTSSTPTTNKHRSDASRAASGLTLRAPDLEDIRFSLERFAKAGVNRDDRGDISRYLTKHAATIDRDAAEYLGALVGMRAASVGKLLRDAVADVAKAEAKRLASEQARQVSRAIFFADMKDSYFRKMIADHGRSHSEYNLRELGKELKAYRSLALHAKSGPLAAKSRLAKLRERIALVAVAVDTYTERHEGRTRRHKLQMATAIVKAWRDASDRSTVSYATMRDLSHAGDVLGEFGRLSSLKASGDKLSHLAHLGQTAITAENERVRLLEREERRLAGLARVADWLAGKSVGRVDFDAESGGAALRIVGDVLETSHGASVPLSHAVKVFQFVKLIREREGATARDHWTAWTRNGKTIRVGHFQVDKIYSDGSFVAGCHTINWPEVERVAKAHGLFDVAASDSAVVAS